MTATDTRPLTGDDLAQRWLLTADLYEHRVIDDEELDTIAEDLAPGLSDRDRCLAVGELLDALDDVRQPRPTDDRDIHLLIGRPEGRLNDALNALIAASFQNRLRTSTEPGDTQ